MSGGGAFPMSTQADENTRRAKLEELNRRRVTPPAAAADANRDAMPRAASPGLFGRWSGAAKRRDYRAKA
jgi:hypothetical protein